MDSKWIRIWARLDFDTPIESYTFRGLPFLIKRDDLIDTKINGNKAYKFYFLLRDNHRHIVSYGGNQSNAMLCLSHIAKMKNIDFTYFTNTLGSYLREHISGNLSLALQNGMHIKYATSLKDTAFAFAMENNALFLPQGGALKEASIGLEMLAKSILALGIENLCVFYASGSGTSSLFLSKFLKPYKIDVWTTNCVGPREYLIEQFLTLECDSHPNIIATSKKFSFAKPYIEILAIYQEWLKCGVEFDLLYDCVMWEAIANNIDLFKSYKHRLFIHSGGLSGNASQLERYKYKKLYNPRDLT